MTEPTDRPGVRLRDVFNLCNDIAAVREFYVDLLGVKEVSFVDTEPFGWLSTDSAGFQMMWFRAEETLPVPTEFACQPGWEGSTREVTSWAVQIPDADFAGVHARLREAGTPMLRPDPEWRQDSYRGHSVLDPMGVTVEVFAVPAEKPAETTWPG